MLASLGWNDPLIFHVTFVPHQDDLGIIPWVRFDLSWPKRKRRGKKKKKNDQRKVQQHEVKEKKYIPQMTIIAKNEAQMSDI